MKNRVTMWRLLDRVTIYHRELIALPDQIMSKIYWEEGIMWCVCVPPYFTPGYIKTITSIISNCEQHKGKEWFPIKRCH